MKDRLENKTDRGIILWVMESGMQGLIAIFRPCSLQRCFLCFFPSVYLPFFFRKPLSLVFLSFDLPLLKKTSLTEVRHQMRSGDLPAYLSLNCLFNDIFSCSRCDFVRIQTIAQKFNLCVRQIDGRTDRRTHRFSEMRERI